MVRPNISRIGDLGILINFQIYRFLREKSPFFCDGREWSFLIETIIPLNSKVMSLHLIRRRSQSPTFISHDVKLAPQVRFLSLKYEQIFQMVLTGGRSQQPKFSLSNTESLVMPQFPGIKWVSMDRIVTIKDRSRVQNFITSHTRQPPKVQYVTIK
jgi:hypothetical protein